MNHSSPTLEKPCQRDGEEDVRAEAQDYEPAPCGSPPLHRHDTVRLWLQDEAVFCPGGFCAQYAHMTFCKLLPGCVFSRILIFSPSMHKFNVCTCQTAFDLGYLCIKSNIPGGLEGKNFVATTWVGSQL